jgi:hypothetical protein
MMIVIRSKDAADPVLIPYTDENGNLLDADEMTSNLLVALVALNVPINTWKGNVVNRNAIMELVQMDAYQTTIADVRPAALFFTMRRDGPDVNDTDMESLDDISADVDVLDSIFMPPVVEKAKPRSRFEQMQERLRTNSIIATARAAGESTLSARTQERDDNDSTCKTT